MPWTCASFSRRCPSPSPQGDDRRPQVPTTPVLAPTRAEGLSSYFLRGHLPHGTQAEPHICQDTMRPWLLSRVSPQADTGRGLPTSFTTTRGSRAPRSRAGSNFCGACAIAFLTDTVLYTTAEGMHIFTN